jgi:hypothetical protein
MEIDNNTFVKETDYKMYIFESIGWVGSGMTLVAYTMALSKESILVLNCLGCSGIVMICLYKKTYQPVILNSAWIIGSIYNYFK